MDKDEKSIEKGLGFGITSAVITAMGVVVGLDSATHSFKAVIAGLVAIAIADALSDSLGIHISEESQSIKDKHVWIATVITLLSKTLFAISFMIPFFLMDMNYAVYTSIAWGFVVLVGYNYRLARIKKENPVHIIGEHVFIAIIVIMITRYTGWIVNMLIKLFL
ncbi:hypothetical protein GF336_01160 [Candidatus Woesearchaeota archaeon]|nr:hypothetical protein [Candidatus Woesearchaeota archaeon]